MSARHGLPRDALKKASLTCWNQPKWLMWTDTLVLGSIILAEKSIPHTCDRRATRKKTQSPEGKWGNQSNDSRGHRARPFKKQRSPSRSDHPPSCASTYARKLGQEGFLQGGRATGSGVPCACLASTVPIWEFLLRQVALWRYLQEAELPLPWHHSQTPISHPGFPGQVNVNHNHPFLPMFYQSLWGLSETTPVKPGWELFSSLYWR